MTAAQLHNSRMRKALVALLVLIAVAEAVVIAAFMTQSQVSTLEIDRDRATISAQVTEAEAATAKYSGGLIKTFLDLKISILHSTLAMLDQKRASYLRIIALNYTIDGKAISEASDNVLRDILEELQGVERKVAEAKQEASKYTGGLLQTMALLKAATEDVSASSLRLKFYSAKYGIPIQIPSTDLKAPAAPKPGMVVKDREAL